MFPILKLDGITEPYTGQSDRFSEDTENMPFILPPLLWPILLLLMVAPVALLALLPAYPRNRIVLALWVVGLIVEAALVIWQVWFSPPKAWEDFWIVPLWHRALSPVFIVAIPFLVSFLLWRRRRSGSGMSATVSTSIIVALCLTSWLTMRTFNQQCVFFDVLHDGDARGWCPDSWQVQPVFGSDGKRL